MLGDAETGIVEAVKIPIRDLDAPAVADSVSDFTWDEVRGHLVQ